MKLKNMKKCKNCEYFAKDIAAGVNAGLCKLNPPVPIPFITQAGININMFWPAVKYEDHCGQFEQKIDLIPDRPLKLKTESDE